MAYALVGSVGTVATGTTTAAPAFAQATTAGHLLIAWVMSDGPSGISVTGTGWVAASTALTTLRIFYRENCGAGETAPAITATGGLSTYAALAEFSGGATTGALDKIGTATPSVTPSTVTASAADVAAGQLLVSVEQIRATKAGTDTTSDSYNNGATPTTNLNNDASSVSAHYRFAWGVTTGKSAANTNTVASASMNFLDMSLQIVSFKLVAAAAAPIPDVGMALTVT